MKHSRLKLVTAAAFALVIGAAVSALTSATIADAAGVNAQFCGGVADIPCPAGFVCVPVEGCDPLIDSCPGRCRRNR